MELIDNVLFGFSVALSMKSLLFAFIGVTLGTFIGVIPGIGPLSTIAILLPMTFHTDPTSGIIMLAGIYYGAQYGGSTASILLNLPGTPTAVVTCLDGYPMAKNGKAGVALFLTTIASFVGSFIGIVVLIVFAMPLAALALKFGAPEYFALVVLGLMAAALIGSGSQLSAVAMVVIGLLIGIVGTDINTGTQRFTFGFSELFDGVNLVAVAMGLFGVSEIIANAGRMRSGEVRASDITLRSMIPTREEFKVSILPMLRGSCIGVGFGVLPGTGSGIASFISYAIEKRIARNPERFGKGAIEGIASPEAANNAAAQAGFIPTLGLGIPGDVVMAVILGALMIHGIVPGPGLVLEHPDLFWGVIASFLVGNVMLLILNLPLIGIWVRILTIPYQYLYPAILAFICIGVYSINNSVFDVGLVVLFGFVGYGMLLLGLAPAPLLMGFILGPMLEENFRRTMILFRGDLTRFFERPLCMAVLALLVLLVISMVRSRLRARKELAAE